MVLKKNILEYILIQKKKDDKEYVSRIERIITKKIPKIKKDLIEKYRPLTSESGKFEITIFEYKSMLELGNNFFFW